MNHFSGYMNSIKAEEKLKEKTKAFVKTALSNNTQQKINVDRKFGRNVFVMKKIWITVSAVAACALLAVGGRAYYNTPVNYVSFDINPSVELGVNAFNTVVCAQAYNEDGEMLLEQNKYTYLSLEKALDYLVLEAAEQGFVAENGSTVIAVTAESNNEETAAELQTKCEDAVNKSLNDGEISAIVYADCSNLQLRTQAQEMGISPGKYKLIELLQALDSTITVEQYKNAKVTDIISAANRLMLSSENTEAQNGEYSGALKMIQGAAQQIHAALGNTEQEQNMNQGSDTSVQEQERNQNADADTQCSGPGSDTCDAQCSGSGTCDTQGSGSSSNSGSGSNTSNTQSSGSGSGSGSQKTS